MKTRAAAMPPVLDREAALAAVLESMAEGLVLQGLDGAVLLANPAAERILGLSLSQLQGLTSMDPRWQAVDASGSPLSGQQHPSMVVLRTGLPQRDCVMGVDVPGQGRRWLRVSASPVCQDGVVAGVVASFVDATPELELQAQLQRNSAELEDLYQQAPCGYHSLDREGLYQRINDTELAWLGCSREQVIGKLGPVDFFTDEGKALFASSFPRLQHDGRIDELEFDLLNREGGQRRVHLSVTVIRNAAGEYESTRSVFYDVTELRRLEAERAALLRQQTAMLDNDMIGMVKLQDRKTLWANRGVQRIFGWSQAELPGLPSRVLYRSDEAYEAFGAAAYPVLSRGGTFRTQEEMRRADGSPVWIDASGTLLDSATGESLWLLADISGLKAQQHQIEHLAHHDALTGLPNRLLLTDRVEQALAQAQRDRLHVAVCYLDLDGFKPVNDQHGHAAGDQLLKEIAQRLLGCVRAHDTVCRLGGDEFVVLLGGLASESEFEPVLERLLSELQRPVALDGGIEVAVSASVGVALYPEDADAKGALLRLADQAMYQAKQAGRRRWLRWRPGLSP
jgi:diguanylate cyclase (GGDEF)-like protein/PAS domain S-box-containing protein